jgi:hypothetical protein
MKEQDNVKDNEINSLFIGTIMCEEVKEPDEDEESKENDEVEPTERVFSVGTIPDDEVIEWMGNTYDTAAPRTNNLGEMMAWVQANEMLRNNQVTLTRVNHVTGNGVGRSHTTTDGSQTVIVGDGKKTIIKKSGGINLVLEGSTCKLHLKDTKMVPDITKNIIPEDNQLHAMMI